MIFKIEVIWIYYVIAVASEGPCEGAYHRACLMLFSSLLHSSSLLFWSKTISPFDSGRAAPTLISAPQGLCFYPRYFQNTVPRSQLSFSKKYSKKHSFSMLCIYLHWIYTFTSQKWDHTLDILYSICFHWLLYRRLLFLTVTIVLHPIAVGAYYPLKGGASFYLAHTWAVSNILLFK